MRHVNRETGICRKYDSLLFYFLEAVKIICCLSLGGGLSFPEIIKFFVPFLSFSSVFDLSFFHSIVFFSLFLLYLFSNISFISFFPFFLFLTFFLTFFLSSFLSFFFFFLFTSVLSFLLFNVK